MVLFKGDELQQHLHLSPDLWGAFPSQGIPALPTLSPHPTAAAVPPSGCQKAAQSQGQTQDLHVRVVKTDIIQGNKNISWHKTVYDHSYQQFCRRFTHMWGSEDFRASPPPKSWVSYVSLSSLVLPTILEKSRFKNTSYPCTSKETYKSEQEAGSKVLIHRELFVTYNYQFVQ